MLNFVCNVLVKVTKFFLLKRSYFVCIIEIDKEKVTSDIEGIATPAEAERAFQKVSESCIKTLELSIYKKEVEELISSLDQLKTKESHGK